MKNKKHKPLSPIAFNLLKFFIEINKEIREIHVKFPYLMEDP